MRRLAVVLILLPAWCAAQPPGATGRNTQVSSGNCSPNIVGSGSGPVTVQFTGSCNSVDPRLLRQLTQSMQKFLAQFPKTIGNLNELLDKKNVELKEKVREVEDWTKKYRELSQRLEEQPSDDELSKQAGDALKEGKLSLAEALLRELLAKEEQKVDRTARNHFNLGELYELRFQPPLALPEYEKAYRYRPQEFSYALAYAVILHAQNRRTEAEPVYLDALRKARNFSKDSVIYLPEVAMTLNNLGVLYGDTRRLKEAEAAYTQCLETYQQLAKENAAAYLPYVAAVLINLGVLYHDTQRLKEAEAAYTQCLIIRRQLAKQNTEDYLPDVAMTLNNLGNLYSATRRLKEAEAAYIECLTTYRQLAKENVAAYLPNVAMTLNNLRGLYSNTQRLKEAEAAYTECLATHRQLAKENAAAYLPNVAAVLSNLGVLYHHTRRLKEAEEAYTECLATYRQLVMENEAAYLPEVAVALNNLGNLYSNTQRLKEAEAPYTECLTIRRELAKENEAVYLPDVAVTLNNLAVLYRNTQRLKEAEVAYTECMATYRQLVKKNHLAYSDELARSILDVVLFSNQNPARICALAQEASEAAMSPKLKDAATSIQKRVCEAAR